MTLIVIVHSTDSYFLLLSNVVIIILIQKLKYVNISVSNFKWLRPVHRFQA